MWLFEKKWKERVRNTKKKIVQFINQQGFHMKLHGFSSP